MKSNIVTLVKQIKINPTSKPNKSMIKVELCKYLSLKNIKFEVDKTLGAVRYDNGPIYYRKNCRPDIIVFDSQNKLVAIIEVKSEGKRNGKKSKRTKKVVRYEQFGAPVLVCIGESQVEKTINNIEQLVLARETVYNIINSK